MNIGKKLSLLGIVGLGALSCGLTSCESGVKIGILQPVQHAALDEARLGFIEVLKDAGFKDSQIVYRNAGGKDNEHSAFAKDLVSTCSLVLGIGTGSSQLLQGAIANDSSNIPLLFTAVTDPVDAKLVDSVENTKGNVCGTTDANPVEEQIKLIKEMLPDADKIGVFFTQSESNSEVQAKQAEAAAKEVGLQVVRKTCNDTSDLKASVDALAATEGLDAIYVPTDNNVAANMNAVQTAAEDHDLLVVCGEENMLKTGGHVSLSIDYHKLGRSTGEMAVRILKENAKPTDFPVEKVPAKDCAYVFNSANMARCQISFSDSVRDAHEWREIQA